MDEKNYIEVIMVEPGKVAKVTTIDDSLESMQNIVGGLIEEYMPFEDDVAIICNEEGKMMQLPPCRAIMDEKGEVMDIIAGPFFMAYAPIESEKFLSMPADLREKYLEKFREPEKYYRTADGVKAIKFNPEKDDMER